MCQKQPKLTVGTDTPLTVVRVLYTLNASPQFLLARQRRKVIVELIIEDEGNEPAPTSERMGTACANQRYAKVSLKTCLGAVCNFRCESFC